MAVELHRSGELCLCSSSALEFQLSQSQNDVADDRDALDFGFSEKCFDETQKPWDFEADSSDNSTELVGSSDNQSESEADKNKDDCIAELTRQMAAQFMPDQDKTNQVIMDFFFLCSLNYRVI